jgi:hypothetical protein
MKKRTETEWMELATAYRMSGQSQQAWCEQHGINPYTFRDQLCRMRKKKEPVTLPNPKPTAWVSVPEHYLESPSAGATTPGDASGIEVRIGLFTLSVARDFDETAFERVCRRLRNLC